MVKKLICIILAAFMMLALAACSTAGQTATQSASAETSSAPASSVAQSSAPASSAATTSAQATPDFPEMKLTFSTTDSETSVPGQGYAVMKKYVEDATGGKVKIEIYYTSTLFTQEQEMDAIMRGDLDLKSYHTFQNFLPEWNTFNVPFVYSGLEHYQAYWASDSAKKLVEKAAKETGVRLFTSSAFYRGLRTVNLRTDKKVTKRADLNGVKLRMPNTEAHLMVGNSLGANAVGLASNDIYMGLQTGTIDGQDNAVSQIRSANYYEVTKSATITGHMISEGFICINEKKFQSLSPELQTIFADGAAEAAKYITDTILTQQADDITFLESKGVKVYQLTPEEKAAYAKEVQDWYFANGGKLAAGIDQNLLKEVQALAK